MYLSRDAQSRRIGKVRVGTILAARDRDVGAHCRRRSANDLLLALRAGNGSSQSLPARLILPALLTKLGSGVAKASSPPFVNQGSALSDHNDILNDLRAIDRGAPNHQIGCHQDFRLSWRAAMFPITFRVTCVAAPGSRETFMASREGTRASALPDLLAGYPTRAAPCGERLKHGALLGSRINWSQDRRQIFALVSARFLSANQSRNQRETARLSLEAARFRSFALNQGR